MVHFLVSLFEGICFAFRGKLDFKQPVSHEESSTGCQQVCWAKCMTTYLDIYLTFIMGNITYIYFYPFWRQKFLK